MSFPEQNVVSDFIHSPATSSEEVLTEFTELTESLLTNRKPGWYDALNPQTGILETLALLYKHLQSGNRPKQPLKSESLYEGEVQALEQDRNSKVVTPTRILGQSSLSSCMVYTAVDISRLSSLDCNTSLLRCPSFTSILNLHQDPDVCLWYVLGIYMNTRYLLTAPLVTSLIIAAFEPTRLGENDYSQAMDECSVCFSLRRTNKRQVRVERTGRHIAKHREDKKRPFTKDRNAQSLQAVEEIRDHTQNLQSAWCAQSTAYSVKQILHKHNSALQDWIALQKIIYLGISI
eukprot:Gb_27955 [translate_table: standard]